MGKDCQRLPEAYGIKEKPQKGRQWPTEWQEHKHTRSVEILNRSDVNQKFQHFFVVFLYTTPYKKGNQVAGQNRVRIGAYRIVQTLYSQ